jgi:hypothetical protein
MVPRVTLREALAEATERFSSARPCHRLRGADAAGKGGLPPEGGSVAEAVRCRNRSPSGAPPRRGRIQSARMRQLLIPAGLSGITIAAAG